MSWGHADEEDPHGNITWMAAKLETALANGGLGVAVQAVVLTSRAQSKVWEE